ncbi:MAG TPA: peptidylprolyl isomerase [Clostridiales bacterium]|nr:peptidylprolyl isomerase [Clostridiales bacterium]
MMIRLIREKLAIVMWIVVAAFIITIIFDWGMGGLKGGSNDVRAQGLIAKINGQDVKYTELKQLEDSYIKSLGDKDMSGVKAAEQRQKAWGDFVKMIVIRQELEKQNITVSKEQVYDQILTNPLPELRNQPQFMTDGVFDQKKWEQFIKNPNPQMQEFYKMIENAYQGRLPAELLQNRVGNSVYLSEFELQELYRQSNLKVQVKWLKASSNEFMPADSLITDEEIEKYFNENPNEFPKTAEQRNFDYVIFSTAPTAKDSALALDDINYALTQLDNGIAFEEVAKNYSEDPSAKSGGDLGYFERGKMVPEFEKAAFEAEIGEIVGPVKTKFGYHIIKVTDKKKVKKEVTEVKASHILVKFKTYQSTYEDAQYSAVNFRDEMYRSGNGPESFNTAAEKLGLKVAEAPFMQKTDRTNELGIVPGMGDFIFGNEPGTISSIMVSDAGYILMRVKEIKPERAKTLDEVRKSIVYKIRQNKGLETAYQKISEVAGSVTDTLTMNSVAAEKNFKTGTSGKFAVDGYVDNVGVDRVMYETALAMDEGQVSGPFKGVQGAYVICLIDKDEFDQKKYDEEKSAFRQRHESYLQRQMVEEWINGLVEKAELVDYRGMYR